MNCCCLMYRHLLPSILLATASNIPSVRSVLDQATLIHCPTNRVDSKGPYYGCNGGKALDPLTSHLFIPRVSPCLVDLVHTAVASFFSVCCGTHRQETWSILALAGSDAHLVWMLGGGGETSWESGLQDHCQTRSPLPNFLHSFKCGSLSSFRSFPVPTLVLSILRLLHATGEIHAKYSLFPLSTNNCTKIIQ
jgi:hypothetical protein